MKFFGQIDKEGKLVIFDSRSYDDYIGRQKKHIGMEITVLPRRKYRSLPQNNLYWAYLGIISEYTGYDTEELHSSFKAMFLTDSRGKIPLVRSTTLLSTQEFTLYLDKIRLFCIETLGIPAENLPNPESYTI